LSDSQSPPNIVIVAIDTLRPDHLGCYGYPRPTSPEIDAVARESIVFDSAFAAGIPTTPSFTTLYTGLHPYRHGIVSHVGQRRLSERIRMLPQLARERGYVTVGIDNLVAQGDGRGSWFARGYDHYSGYLYRPGRDQDARLADRAIEFIQQYTESDPLFLLVHLWSPHTPYGPLPPYDTLHYEPGTGAYDMAEVRRIHPEYYDAFVGDMKLEHPDDYAYVVAQYDGEISQVDAQVGRIVRALRERGAWEDTAFVVISDHGEAFGEGNFHFDHHGLYDAVTRVALLLRLPGRGPGRVGALVSTEDFLPTLAELGGMPLPPYPLTGASLLPLLEGSAEEVRPYVVSSESTRQASLALRTPGWKLILPIVEDARGEPLPDFYGRPRRPDPLLFDLRADPGERHDVSGACPEKLAELLGALEAWRAAMLQATGEPDPIQAQGLSLPYERFMQRVLARQ
jgi:arylsulfatase A-like enzyme